MSKFKVGDKVRTSIELAIRHGDLFGIGVEFWEDSKTRKVLAVYDDNPVQTDYKLSGTAFFWPEYALISAEPHEFIVIRRDDRDVIASHKRGDEIVKTAKATCAPSDEFNFETGAKLAFDRLMGREKPLYNCIGSATPRPAPKFKVGDRVVCDFYGTGTIEKIYFSLASNVAYGVRLESGCVATAPESKLSPAPEPKYYTGKVFAVRTKDDDATPRMQNRVGHVFEIKDGRIVGERWNFDLGNMRPFNSFSDFCKYCSATEWAEVKE